MKQLFSKVEQLDEENSKLHGLIGCQVEQEIRPQHLKNEKSDHQSTKTKLEDENEQLLSNIEQLREEKSKLDDLIGSQVNQLKQAKDEKSDLQSGRTKLEDENDHLSFQIEQLEEMNRITEEYVIEKLEQANVQQNKFEQLLSKYDSVNRKICYAQ